MIVCESGGHANGLTYFIFRFLRRPLADLKNVLMTGDLAGAKIVHIERLNVQIVSGSNNSGVVQFNETDFAKLPPEMQDKMMAIWHSKHRSVDNIPPEGEL